MFQGFSIETVNYLKGLKENNNKQWFEENRDRYKEYLLAPMQQLVLELGPHMLSIDPLFEVSPRKSMSRINRDVRFSNDKSPYRANMWISFKRVYLDWKEEPVYFFEIFPDYYRYGMGFYNIPKEALYTLRSMIGEKKKEFNKVHSLYKKQNTFLIEGDKYKRIINPELTEELNDWYQRKEIYFVCNRKIDSRLFSSGLVKDITDGFKLLEPMYNFFLSLREK
ncbi:MAG TPA: DUF2461 domain-containing protein [Clostridia bacterium]|nr:DUF2461 domain-containing protein [Clostridia bacterium]